MTDPSAEDENQESDSPYIYVANDPISRNDPDGKIWGQIIGAVVGAVVDYGTQVYSNYEANKILAPNKRFNPWTQNINVVSIGTSALEGALTSGESAIKSVGTKIALKVATTVLNNTVELKTSKNGLQAAVSTNVVNIAKNTAIDLTAGGETSLGGKIAKGLVNLAARKTINKAANKLLVSRNGVANTLRKVGLNSRVSSVLARDIREGQKVLVDEVKSIVGTTSAGALNGKSNASVQKVKNDTDVK